MKKYAWLALFVSGCGVSTQHVDNTPPKLHPELVQLSVEYGTFEVLNASAFLWPKDLTEDQAQVLVRTVNSASEAADPFFIQATVLGAETKLLQAQWDQVACVDKYAVLGPDEDPMDVSHVNEWKKIDKAVDPKAADEVSDCEKNQSRREEIVPQLAAAQQGAAPYVDQIDRAIDPDPQNKQNSKTIKIRNLTLSADAAPMVSLGGFTVSGYNPSTENQLIQNAAYDAKLNVLTFDVFEVDDNKVQTGNFYHFALERGNDHGPLARFTGDMNLMQGEVETTEAGKKIIRGISILRYGSARIDAFPPKQ